MAGKWAWMMLPLLLAAGCGDRRRDSSDQAPGNFTPPVNREATPLPGQANGTPITAHIGKYPADAVDGVGFYDRTDISSALIAAVGDRGVRKWVVGRSGPQTPIFQAADGRIVAWGCEQHDCGDHNWAFLFDPKSRRGTLCYHQGGGGSRWYAGAAPVIKPGDCPSEAEG